MGRHVLLFVLLASVLVLASGPSSLPQTITPAPSGPFHIEANRIVDGAGRAFLMRGTQLTDFRLDTAVADSLPGGGKTGAEFGPHSATSLSAIRLRFNMNTVRVPVNVLEAGRPGFDAELTKLVDMANRLDLLVVLAAGEPSAALPSAQTLNFWSRCAARFRKYPNVMFDVFADPSTADWATWHESMESVVRVIRSAGATQPVIVAAPKDGRGFAGIGDNLIADRNVIYQASPRYSTVRSDADRDAHFGFLASRVPVMATGWDPEIANTTECPSFPADPASATAMVRGYLDYFDHRQISWSVSVYEPGKLIKEYSLQDATSLEDGWTCGQRGLPGIGRVIEGHLRASDERSLFVVSAGGGVDVARGGFAIGYGPVMAEKDGRSYSATLPFTLNKVRVDVTDSRGVTRPAGLLWTSAGWGQVNFVVPQESAVGPARMTLVRADGSRSDTKITIADTAPGFWTNVSCRGPAVGTATQLFADGRTVKSELSGCRGAICAARPIPVAPGATTRIQMRGSGFRNAASASKIEVTVGGHRVPVVAYGPAPEAGVDLITIEIPADLHGIGEVELLCHINGRVSNPVQVRVGGEKPVS